MGTFKEYLLKEVGGKGGGFKPSAMRNPQATAPYQYSPPLSVGRSAVDYHQGLERWEQDVLTHISSLVEAGKVVEINGKTYLSEVDLDRYHKAALHFLEQKGVFVKGGTHRDDIVGIDTAILSKILYEEDNAPGSSGLNSNDIALLQWLWEEHQQRRLINKSYDNNWGRRNSTFVLKNNLEEAISHYRANIAELYAKEILTHEDVLNFYQIDVQQLHSALTKKYYKGVASGFASQAIDAAFQSTFQSGKGATQTMR